MNRVANLQVPQIVVTQDHNEKVKRIPSIKISIEGASSDEDDDSEPETRTRLRPNSLRWCGDKVV